MPIAQGAPGRTLYAKVPAMTNGDRFPKTAFTLDVAAAGGGTCPCPGGQTTRELRGPAGGPQQFVFATATCGACPLHAQCVTGTGGRTSARHPQETVLQQARAFQASDAFDEVRRRRQAAEHRLARLVQLGLRQARAVGHPKGLFQLALAVAVANLTRLAHAAITAPATEDGTATGALLGTLAGIAGTLAALLTTLLTLVLAQTAPLGPLLPLRPATGATGWSGQLALLTALRRGPSHEIAGSRPDC